MTREIPRESGGNIIPEWSWWALVAGQGWMPVDILRVVADDVAMTALTVANGELLDLEAAGDLLVATGVNRLMVRLVRPNARHQRRPEAVRCLPLLGSACARSGGSPMWWSLVFRPTSRLRGPSSRPRACPFECPGTRDYQSRTEVQVLSKSPMGSPLVLIVPIPLEATSET